jgi:REP element-mobilizing transposase RayT
MLKKNKPGRKGLRKGRYSQVNGIYLVTTVTEGRVPRFGVFAAACVMSRFMHGVGDALDVNVLCWVVMPDHVHFLVDISDKNLSTVVGRIKGSSARAVNLSLQRKGKFWADGFHDHALRKEEDLLTTSRYIVANPVRAGLVKSVRNHPFWNAAWF